MKSFIKISVGHKVYDTIQNIQGIVLSIDYSTNTAQITTGSPSEEEAVTCKLFNLTVLGKSKHPLEIKIKYFHENSTRLTKIAKGDWIDLRAAETIEMKAGEFKLIPLGVAMKLPINYEAIVAPRSSTFKNFGVIETNSIGVIDNSYSGDTDQWFFPAYALRDTAINFDERICQFRIQERMPEVSLETTKFLDGESRGGHGSTGIM